MTKFFYAPDAADAPAAPAEPVNIAAAMAKSGQMTTPDRPYQAPVEPAAPPAPEPPAAPAQAAPQPTAPVLDTPAAQPPQPTAPVQAPTLTEFLKGHKPDAVLRELGYDDRMIGFLGDARALDGKMLSFLDDWKSGADLRPRLEALTTDFNKMSAADVMKYQLRQQNPELSGSEFERLYQRRVLDHYKVDGNIYTEQEVADGNIDLSIDAKPIREQLIKQQQELLLPKSPEPQAAPPSPEVTHEQQVEAFRTQLRGDATIANLLQTKILPIGEGAEQFKFGIEPDKLLDVMSDNKQWANVFYDKVVQPDGTLESTFNSGRLARVTAYAINETAYLQSMAAHFKALGAQAAVAPIENATPPAGNPSAPQPVPQSVAEAMAKQGKWSRQ